MTDLAAEAQAWVDTHIGIWLDEQRAFDLRQIEFHRARCYYQRCDWDIGITEESEAERLALHHAGVHIARGELCIPVSPDLSTDDGRPF